MKTFAFLSVLLPAAAFCQVLSPSVPRVDGDPHRRRSERRPGLYLKQVNGPLLAVQNDRYILRPCEHCRRSSLLLYAMELCPDRGHRAEHADHAFS